MDLSKFLGKNNGTVGIFKSVDDLLSERENLAKKYGGINFFETEDKLKILEFIALDFADSLYGDGDGRLSVVDAYGSIRGDLLDREDIATTAPGGGIAYPHCRTKGVFSTFIGIYVIGNGVDWNAMDKKRVYLIQPFISPKDAVISHMSMQSNIFSLKKHDDYVEKILHADKPDRISEILHSYKI